MKVHDVVQRSVEWHQLRLGKLCGSRAADMMATIKIGEAAARRDLRVQLVVERLTGQSAENGYVSVDMQRGIDKEQDALAAYEALTGELVRPCGFVEHDTLPAGCSPDGIIGSFVGLLEIKAPKSATHLSYLRAGTVPKEYLHQIVHGLWITGAKWADFVSFDDRFPVSLQLFRVRFERDEAAIASFELVARQFLAEVDAGVAELEQLAVVPA